MLCVFWVRLQIELEAARRGTTQIFHRVFFPDGLQRVVEIGSCSRVRDLCAKIASLVQLKSPIGFSLFIKIGEKGFFIQMRSYIYLNFGYKLYIYIYIPTILQFTRIAVVSLPDTEFFFDFVSQMVEWARKSAPRKDGFIVATSPVFAYRIHFMRKLWIDVLPGAEPNIDLIFHYHQVMYCTIQTDK